MLRRQRDHDHRILRPLTFMHRCRIGQGHFIQFPDVIRDDPPSKSISTCPSSGIDLGHLSDVAVVDILLVVIDRLKHFIPRGIGPAKPGHLGRGIRIQSLLQHCIEGACARDSHGSWA